MLTIYTGYGYPEIFKGILRDLRPIWAAEELGMPYLFHWLNAAANDHKAEANRAVNPFGKVPSIKDGAFALFESGAIVAYLYEKAGRIGSDAQDRSLLAQWCFAAVNTVEPPMAELFNWDILWRDRDGRDRRRAELVQTAATRLKELDDALGHKHFLLGTEFSCADILMVTAIRFARTAPEIFTEAGRVAAYVERCEARPAFRTALAAQGRGPAAAAA
jgi:glutathione S-transferase